MLVAVSPPGVEAIGTNEMRLISKEGRIRTCDEVL